MRILTSALVLALMAAVAGCKTSAPSGTAAKTEKGAKDGTQTTATGLRYKLIPGPNSSGRKPAQGEIMNLELQYDNGADSVLFSTWGKTPVLIPVMEPSFKGGIEEGFTMLSPGDSAIFFVNADSLFQKTFRQPTPPFIKQGATMKFTTKLLGIMSQEEATAEQQRQFEDKQKESRKHAGEQAAKDELLLQDYIKKNNLKATRLPSGLYYVITKTGTGANAKAGQTVKVHYTGTTLDGKKFDSSVDRGQPFSFSLGQGQVIRGWDEGIPQLNKGAKAILLIPSGMAYGERSPSPAIPPNGILRFDVELIDMQ